MTPELNREYPAPNEQEVFDQMVEITRDQMTPVCGHVRRAQHAKATGCVAAEFRIAEHVPLDLRYGIFRRPGRTFNAIVRFSNAQDTFERDGKPTARGFAIKVLDVEGERALGSDGDNTQDFLMVNHPVFPFSDPKEYLETMRRRAIPKIGGIWALLTLEKGERAIRRDILGHKVASPLEIKYWSGSPYWLGPAAGDGGHAVKYLAVSRQAGRTPPPDDPDDLPDDYLTQALARDLRAREAVFDFMVQLQKDPVAMPVEDVSVEWDEQASEPIHVATLRIPPQEVDVSGDLATRCELMSFNPWHALAEHRPMGGMNRLRRAVYQASFAKRAPA